MKNLFVLALLTGLSAWSCKPATPADTAADNGHNAANSLDVAGLYTGVVPCADCEGIETSLTLSDGMVFTLDLRYLGKEPELKAQYSGRYTWNKEGNTIILGGLSETMPSQYFVGENQLIQLDLAGNRITSGLADNYILTMQ